MTPRTEEEALHLLEGAMTVDDETTFMAFDRHHRLLGNYTDRALARDAARAQDGFVLADRIILWQCDDYREKRR